MFRSGSRGRVGGDEVREMRVGLRTGFFRGY